MGGCQSLKKNFEIDTYLSNLTRLEYISPLQPLFLEKKVSERFRLDLTSIKAIKGTETRGTVVGLFLHLQARDIPGALWAERGRMEECRTYSRTSSRYQVVGLLSRQAARMLSLLYLESCPFCHTLCSMLIFYTSYYLPRSASASAGTMSNCTSGKYLLSNR